MGPLMAFFLGAALGEEEAKRQRRQEEEDAAEWSSSEPGVGEVFGDVQEIVCPECGDVQEVPEDDYEPGQRFWCRKCGARFSYEDRG